VFGLAPTRYRKLSPDDFRIDRTARYHFAPTGYDHRQGKKNMNVTELMTQHHCWEMTRLIDACRNLSADQLDRPIPAIEPEPWQDRTVTLRQMLGRASAFAAPWMEAINGESTNYSPETIEEMASAIDVNREGFLKILSAVDEDRSYGLTFVDTGCTPPLVFSYGGVIAHALTNAAYRRMAIVQAIQPLNTGVDQVRDPIDYVAATA
jgi:hypothetical protein